MDTYNDVWEAVLEYCKTKASSTGYKLWIADAEIKDFKNNTFILCLSSPLKKKIVMEQYGTLLKEAFENVMGFEVWVDNTAMNPLTYMSIEDTNKKEESTKGQDEA